MADFRRWIPVLAVVVLLMGTAFTASAQIIPPFNCTVNNAVPNQVRAEGIAELVGDVLITCSGGTPAAAGTTIPTLVNVQVFLNTNVTSKVLSTSTSPIYTEAMMLIDEPSGAQQKVCTSDQQAIGGCTVKGTGGVTSPYLATGAFNVWQGQAVGTNSLLWVGVPIDPPGTSNIIFQRTIRITNVRANANQLGVSSTLIPASILMFISTTPNTSLPISNSTQTVAFVQAGLTFGTGQTSATPLSQCNNTNNDVTASPANTYSITFTENFLTAFKLSGIGTDQNVPGKNYGTESGFSNSIAFTGNALNAGVASQATRVMAEFAGIPTGVTLYVTQTQTNTAANHGSANLVVATDLSGNGGVQSVAGNAAGTVSKIGIFPITSTGTGTGIAVWEVTAANPSVTEVLTFGVVVSYTANTAQNLPGLGSSTVAGTFAPTSTLTASNATGASAAAVPRFADTSGGTLQAAFTIGACVTDILFPFVTNQAGFDTGIAIANTSLDPFGTTAQTGPCTLYYFGNTTGGGAAPNAQTTGSVAAGTVLLFSLSSGGTGVAATPGFSGYLIAQCTFQYAHAFAFVSDLGAQKLAEGYLGLILDSGANVTRVNVNGIGPANTRAESRSF